MSAPERIPFDLDRALAGDPVVTRDGNEVTQLHRFSTNDDRQIVGVVHGRVNTWRLDGRFRGWDDFDLFMTPKTMQRWARLRLIKTTTEEQSNER